MSHQPELMPDHPSREQSARDAERAEYLDRLRGHLHDPDFRAIEGFPIGDDDAILALSDPPYYTACPNPFLPEIIQRWRTERAELRQELGLPDDSHDNGNSQIPNSKFQTPNPQSPITNLHSPPVYHREPFASDVSEGKNDPIYNAHSYHTKVPHKAVMRYILHYTDPGDIVFDGFCGTGMTGVAAQLCGDRGAVEELGYRVSEDGIICDGDKPVCRLGIRKAILLDLCPIASFIAYNLNTAADMASFEREANHIIREVENQYGWMYETLHTDGKTKGCIHYVVWSDVVACPNCSTEMVYWEAAVDVKNRKVYDPFQCPNCGVNLTTRSVQRVTETIFDQSLQQPAERAKQLPVMISYSVGRKRFKKLPDQEDLALIQQLDARPISSWHPIVEIPRADRYFKDSLHLRKLTHVHHLYTRRNLAVLAAVWERIANARCSHRTRSLLKAWFTALLSRLDYLNRYMPQHNRHVGPLVGTLYISWLSVEISALNYLRSKLRSFQRLQSVSCNNAVSTGSCTRVFDVPSNIIDYVFIDPPFGHNLMYSELNHRWESWLGVFSSTEQEAVVSESQGKSLLDYQRLMERSFVEIHRVLRPGRWMTVEFHNTRNSVWNSIQEALSRAGFVIGDVRTLDKKKGTTNQLFYADIAKQDLVISAYKPRSGFERRFLRNAGTADGTWEFVRQHLAQLPITVKQDGALEIVAERQPYLLFDRMVAFHIQRGATVPLSAAEFYAGLRERFAERDGMFFLPDQVPEYDRARLEAAEIAQLALFVSDEKSTIQWLRQQLDPATGGRPQTYQDLQPQFLRQLHQARHEVLPELSEMLEQNFLQDVAGRWYVPDPTKSGDLEKLRQRALLREFAEYVEGSGRLRRFRTEAVRTGFADAWHRRDYAIIVKVAGRLPERVLQEDPDLLMYYDNATLRMD